jgi:hypothetical protein
MKRSLFGLVCLLVTSIASVMFAAQNAEPPRTQPREPLRPRVRVGGVRAEGVRAAPPRRTRRLRCLPCRSSGWLR